MDKRQQKGMEIAKAKTIRPTNGGWLVKSQASDNCYKVDEEFTCNCPDAECRGVTCKHAYAVRYFLQIERETAKGTQTDKIRITHKQAWTAYNQAQTAEVRLFDELLKDLTQGIEEAPQGFGRPKLAMRETAFCAIQKVYSQLSSRRAVSLFGNAVEKGQIGHKPHFNAVSKLLNRKDLTPILHDLLAVSASPLKSVEADFAIDSSGFRTSSFNSYATEKYTLKRQHKWLKAHIMTGVKTNVVTSIEVTDEDGADSPQLKPLVMATTNAGFTTHEVSADKAYSSRNNYEVVRQAGGQAYIPFRSNATGKSGGSLLWKKMFHYFQMNQEEFLQHYHKRSNVESTFAAVKKKFGETLKSKNRIAQENELLCKFIAYNLTVVIQEMHELGVRPDFCTQSQTSAPNVA